MPGQLIIKLMKGDLTRDTETFGKMDPFVIVKIGNQKFTGSVCNDGGKHPVWSDVFTHKRTTEQLIEFEVWEYDSLSNNDLIGQGSFALATLDQGNHTYIGNVSLQYKGKPAGTLYVNLQFNPDFQVSSVIHKQILFFHTKQNQGHPGQGIPQPQGYPPQGYPPQQGFPPQGVPPQNYPPQQQYPGQQYPPQQYPPPGQQHPPPGQQYPPPGQQYPPPGQQYPPPGQQYPPPGQQYPPPGQQYPPPGQQYPPPGQQYPPPGQSYPPPGQSYPPPGQQHPTGQQYPPAQYPPQGYPAQVHVVPQGVHQQGVNVHVQVKFNPHCHECHGTGTIHKKGKNKPCKECYKHSGLCPKCGGSGWNHHKNKACKCKKHH